MVKDPEDELMDWWENEHESMSEALNELDTNDIPDDIETGLEIAKEWGLLDD
ncbi:hypothetical protein ACQVQT_00620 [Bacillus paranthracis]|uniref:Uncharacterized protein n=1 Tax=Bacillus paranthracis TaxID=2026186 RepID=A0A7D8D9A3_9BACI|nr:MULTISPECIES: hypothetical protein [Bacillus cereus group]EJR17266.1 hypothetical protein II7_01450 [Bacillus cereus MSX-A12]MBQ6447829.1 hypothetical protein [Bacillus sp. (in: firmicutes)]QPA42402.1 hypothetical protein INQ58_14025 [Bacillus cereus]MCC2403264.1 hypothetical protein [Bacillus paranthracis]MCC2477130.1 hypothetical protein [Bacillus paranthracis]